eukprot:3193379-Amphidinium_carterae.1
MHNAREYRGTGTNQPWLLGMMASDCVGPVGSTSHCAYGVARQRVWDLSSLEKDLRYFISTDRRFSALLAHPGSQ